MNNDMEVSKLSKTSLLPIITNCSIKWLDLHDINMCTETIQNVVDVKPLTLISLI